MTNYPVALTKEAQSSVTVTCQEHLFVDSELSQPIWCGLILGGEGDTGW